MAEAHRARGLPAAPGSSGCRRTAVARPRFPAIDAHNHLGTRVRRRMGDAVGRRPRPRMDAAGVEAIVDLDGGWGDGAAGRDRPRWQDALPAALRCSPGSTTRAGRRTRRSARPRRRGCATAWQRVPAGSRSGSCWGSGRGTRAARWCRSTTRAWTRCGRRPASSASRSRSTSPTRSPSSTPLDAENERWEELRDHPDWHFWPTRPPGRPDADGFPPFDELIDGLEAVVARHPGTTFIGAHVGCAAEDLARVSVILERCPNFNVDIAARIAELGRQPYTATGVRRALGGPRAVRDRHGARRRRGGRSTTGSSRRPTSRSPYDAEADGAPRRRAAGGSTAWACPTTCSGTSTAKRAAADPLLAARTSTA